MPENLVDADEQIPDNDPARPAPLQGSPWLAVIKAVAFLSVIVAVQVVGASMLIPSAQETERLARQYVAAGAGHAASRLRDGDSQTNDRQVEAITEVDMGAYHVTHFNPVTNTTLSIDFELYGAVLAKNRHEFQAAFERNKNRVRERVIMILHGAESKDLSDAGLGLIKRRILEKVNRALGQPLLTEVLFSKFNFVER